MAFIQATQVPTFLQAIYFALQILFILMPLELSSKKTPAIDGCEIVRLIGYRRLRLLAKRGATQVWGGTPFERQ